MILWTLMMKYLTVGFLCFDIFILIRILVTVDDLKRMKASGQEKESHLMTKELKNRNRQRQRIQQRPFQLFSS